MLTDTRVRRIRIVGGRAVGVECVGTGGPVDLTADRIVLSAGAIGSAHLLMLSGIGPQRRAERSGGTRGGGPAGRHGIGGPPGVGAAGGLDGDSRPSTAGGGVDDQRWTRNQALYSGVRCDDQRAPRRSGRSSAHRGRPDAAEIARQGPAGRPRIPRHLPAIEHRYDSEPADVAALQRGCRTRARTGRRAGEIRDRVVVDLATPVRYGADGRATTTRRRWWMRSAGSAASTGYGWSTARCFPPSPAAARTPPSSCSATGPPSSSSERRPPRLSRRTNPNCRPSRPGAQIATNAAAASQHDGQHKQ